MPAAPFAPPPPTNAELELLRVLWRNGPQTVKSVHSAARRSRGGRPREVRYTTTLKTLQVMTEKGLVTRDERERSHIYRAAVPERAVKRRLVADLLDRAFDGSAAGLVMHALSTKRASSDELRQIRELLDGLNGNGR